MPFPDGTGMAGDLFTNQHAANAAALAEVGAGPPAVSGPVGETPGGWPAGLAPQDARSEMEGMPSYLNNAAAFVPSPENRDPMGGTPNLLADPTQPVRYEVPEAPAAVAAAPEGPPAPAGPPAADPEMRLVLLSQSLAQPLHQGTEDDDGLVWKIACKTGTLALSPGPGQIDVEEPLILTGELFRDMKQSFDEQAFPHVTVPETHANGPLENTGYVRAVEVLDYDAVMSDPRVTEKAREVIAGDPADTEYLLCGVEFTEPDVKQRALNGSIPDTSIGVKFGYRAKRTGKLFRAAFEHLNLTPVPWVDGLPAFGLSQQGKVYDAEKDEPIPQVYIDMPELNASISARVSSDGGRYEWDLEDIDPDQIRSDAATALVLIGDNSSLDMPLGVKVSKYGKYFIVYKDYERVHGIAESADEALDAAMACLRAKYEEERKHRSHQLATPEPGPALPPWPEGKSGEEYALSLSGVVSFDPKKHPRDYKGRFKDVLGGLALNKSVELPDGTKVTRVKTGVKSSKPGESVEGQGFKIKAKDAHPVYIDDLDEASTFTLKHSNTAGKIGELPDSLESPQQQATTTLNKSRGNGVYVTEDPAKPGTFKVMKRESKVQSTVKEGLTREEADAEADAAAKRLNLPKQNPLGQAAAGATRESAEQAGRAGRGKRPKNKLAAAEAKKEEPSKVDSRGRITDPLELQSALSSADWQRHQTLQKLQKQDQAKGPGSADRKHRMSQRKKEIDRIHAKARRTLGLSVATRRPLSEAMASATGDTLPKPTGSGSLSGAPAGPASHTELPAPEHTEEQMPTVEEVLAQQQAEIEALRAQNEQYEQNLSLSQSTVTSLSEQVHTDNVDKRVKKLSHLPPAVVGAVKSILLADNPAKRTPEGGLNLSISIPPAEGQEAKSHEFKSATDVVEYLLSVMPTPDASQAAQQATIHANLDLSAAQLHPDERGHDEKAKADVDAWEREAHPERFDSDGKRL